MLSVTKAKKSPFCDLSLTMLSSMLYGRKSDKAIPLNYFGADLHIYLWTEF